MAQFQLVDGSPFEPHDAAILHVNFTHDKSLFREVNGIVLSAELVLCTNESIGTVEIKLSFDESRQLAKRILERIADFEAIERTNRREYT